MHLLAEQTIDIRCPVEKAYAYTTNLENFGQWFPEVMAIRSTDDRAHAESGKNYLETVRIPLRGERRVRITVVEATPNRFLATEGDLSPVLPRMEIRFEESGADSCRVVWRMFSRNEALFARLVLVPLARGVMGKRAAIGLVQLKKLLEKN